MQMSVEACTPKVAPNALRSGHDAVVSTLNNMQAKVAGCVVGIINGKFGVRNMAKQANILLPGEVSKIPDDCPQLEVFPCSVLQRFPVQLFNQSYSTAIIVWGL